MTEALAKALAEIIVNTEIIQLGVETLMKLYIYLAIMVGVLAIAVFALLGITIYQVDKIKRKLKA